MLLQSPWCWRVCLQPLLGYMAPWDQEVKVTGQRLLAQCSSWEVLEKRCCTSCRENCLSSKMLLGALSQGVLLLRDASPFHALPFQLHPRNALIVFGGDFQLRLKTSASGFCTLLRTELLVSEAASPGSCCLRSVLPSVL